MNKIKCIGVIIILIGLTLNIWAETLIGSGNIVVDERGLPSFKYIIIQGGINLILKHDVNQYLSVETDDNLLEQVKTRVENDTLYIDAGGTVNFSTEPTVYISSDNLGYCEIIGSAEVSSENQLSFPQITFNICGSANVKVDVNVQQISTDISGSASVTYTGQANLQHITIQGSAEVNSVDLVTSITHCDIKGSGHCLVQVSDSLYANISGVGKIDYRGNPVIVKNLSLTGILEKLD